MNLRCNAQAARRPWGPWWKWGLYILGVGTGRGICATSGVFDSQSLETVMNASAVFYPVCGNWTWLLCYVCCVPQLVSWSRHECEGFTFIFLDVAFVLRLVCSTVSLLKPWWMRGRLNILCVGTGRGICATSGVFHSEFLETVMNVRAFTIFFLNVFLHLSLIRSYSPSLPSLIPFSPSHNFSNSLSSVLSLLSRRMIFIICLPFGVCIDSPHYKHSGWMNLIIIHCSTFNAFNFLCAQALFDA